MSRPAPTARVLVAILVYNGREFVPACLESVARMRAAASRRVDVLVLDDCSPEPGWSEELALRCGDLDIAYYRSPRNLGIPRNMNLGALWALTRGHDHLLLLNSDVVVPANLVDALTDVAESRPSVGSVTAWSNNASLYSLPHDGVDHSCGEPSLVDWASATLHEEFGSAALEIPTGVGFCLLMPAPALRRVGLLDPLFGRGYCEEVDWNLRARSLGFTCLLSPGTFVYHRGQGSTVAAGLIGHDQTSVALHERIIAFRHPQYPPELVDFVCSGVLPPLKEQGARAIVGAAARQRGYTVEATGLRRPAAGAGVRFVIDLDGGPPAFTGHFAGFSARFEVPADARLAGLAALLGRLPERVSVFQGGALADRLAEESRAAHVALDDVTSYPERV